MESNFSNRVQDVIRYSRDEAIRIGNDYIGTEHLLLGIIREGGGKAIKIINILGADVSLIRGDIERTSGKAGKTMTVGNIPLTKQSEKVLKITYLEAKIFKSDVIGTEHLLLSMLREDDNLASQILQKYNITYEKVKFELAGLLGNRSLEITREVKEQEKSKTPILDNFAKSFVPIIENDKGDGLDYYFREVVINELIKALLKKEKHHVAIIGEHGSGRRTLIKTIAHRIINGDASLILNKFKFLNFDFQSLISGTKYRGQLEERMNAIVKEINENDNIVLYIEDLIGFSERASFNEYYSFLKSKVKVVTLLTSDEAEAFFKKDSTISNLFNVLRIYPTNKLETAEILKRHIVKYLNQYSVNISESLIEDIIEYSNLYIADGFQPQKSLSILEEICATLELNRFNDPNDVLYDLKLKFDEESKKLEEISNEKHVRVKGQQFEEATIFRDKEKIQVKLVNEIRGEIETTKRENRITVKKDDLILAIHNLTGFNLESIRNKDKILLKSQQSIKNDISGLPQFEFLQTQSILHGNQILIKQGLAFVLIPHNKEFDELFYHNIKPALETHGLNVLKADNILKPGNILSQVWAQIRSAEVIVVDVSGQNSNVIFELGLCYGIQRCPILLTRDPGELPFNIRNLRYIQYENTAAGAHKLGEDLKRAVEEFLSAVRSDSH